MENMAIIGDIHGAFGGMQSLLMREKIIAMDWTWLGEQMTLCFLGDYVNRGDEGLRVLDYLISLQIQAEHAGGQMISLLGNHEVVLLAAHRFGERINTRTNTSFMHNWRAGALGAEEDLERISPEHIAWITHCPAMVRLGDALVVHADTDFYLRYGDTIEEVNARFEQILRSYDPDVWERFLADFAEHSGFMAHPESMERMLKTYGGERIIHGHTNIPTLAGANADFTRPFVYNDGKAIDIDGALSDGFPGILYRL